MKLNSRKLYLFPLSSECLQKHRAARSRQLATAPFQMRKSKNKIKSPITGKSDYDMEKRNNDQFTGKTFKKRLFRDGTND